MRVIVTGGSGLIGRALADSLAKDGHEVVVLSRNPTQVMNLPEGARAEKWDAKTAQGWVQFAEGAAAIVNLAGENLAGSTFFPQRWTPERKRLFFDSRREAGQAVVQAVQKAARKPPVIVQASAVGYYGIASRGEVTEKHPPGKDFQARVCVDWEKSTEIVEVLGVRHIRLRTGIVLSTRGGAFKRLILPFKLFAGGPLGSGRQWFPWIHPEDEVGAIRFLIDNPNASGAFNLCAPQPLTNREFAKVVGKVMHRPSFVPAPGFALRLAFGEAATLVLDGWQAVPQRLKEMGFTFQFPEAETAVRDVLQHGK